jgi:hypothetical protein
VFAEVPVWVVDISVFAAAMVALVAATKLPPVRWLFRQLFAEPATEWLDERLDERLEPIEQRLGHVEDQLSPNSGSSTRDAIDRIELMVTTFVQAAEKKKEQTDE